MFSFHRKSSGGYMLSKNQFCDFIKKWNWFGKRTKTKGCVFALYLIMGVRLISVCPILSFSLFMLNSYFAYLMCALFCGVDSWSRWDILNVGGSLGDTMYILLLFLGFQYKLNIKLCYTISRPLALFNKIY